jgi:hypothetical protein
MILSDALLRVLKGGKKPDEFLPRLFGALQDHAASGDEAALEVCKGIADMLGHPEWLDDLSGDSTLHNRQYDGQDDGQ